MIAKAATFFFLVFLSLSLCTTVSSAGKCNAVRKTVPAGMTVSGDLLSEIGDQKCDGMITFQKTTNDDDGFRLKLQGSYTYEAPTEPGVKFTTVKVHCNVFSDICTVIIAFFITKETLPLSSRPTTSPTFIYSTTSAPTNAPLTTPLPTTTEQPIPSQVSSSSPMMDTTNTVQTSTTQPITTQPAADIPSCGNATSMIMRTGETSSLEIKTLPGLLDAVAFQLQTDMVTPVGMFALSSGVVTFASVRSGTAKAEIKVALKDGNCILQVVVAVENWTTAPPSLSSVPPESRSPGDCGTYLFRYAGPFMKYGDISLDKNVNILRFCSYTMLQFTLLNGGVGVPQLQQNGSFTYFPPPIRQNDSFTFEARCPSNETCRGTAMIELLAIIDSPPPQTSTTNPGPVSPKISCTGTCNKEAWKSAEFLDSWNEPLSSGSTDHMTTRTDGKRVDAVSLSFFNGLLHIISLGVIGNMAARFPTFALVQDLDGSLNTAAILHSKSEKFFPFDAKCLDQQGSSGFGELVWTWTNASTLSGNVGQEYSSGQNFYQKFGGKHVQCDTFQSACQFAPFLNPVDTSAMNWSVDVRGCDTKWKGIADSEMIISNTGENNIWKKDLKEPSQKALSSVLLTEEIKPTSWTQPQLGTKINYRPIALTVQIDDLPSVMIAGFAPFIGDVERFVYSVDGELWLMYNVQLFPKREFFGEVTVSKVSLQEFSLRTIPSSCTSCKGKRTSCSAETSQNTSIPEKTTSLKFRDICGDDGVVEFFAGPLPNSTCNGTIERTRGISDSIEGCNSPYQNLTFRLKFGGTDTSRELLWSVGGKISFSLEVRNTRNPQLTYPLTTVSVMHDSYLAQQAPFAGLRTCRSSPYWPVYDPTGNSIPTKAFELPSSTSYDDEQNSAGGITIRNSGGNLCAKEQERVFGPYDWAYMSVFLDGATANTTVDEISVSVPGGILPYRNDFSEKGFLKFYLESKNPDSINDGYFWKNFASFLNYRRIGKTTGTTGKVEFVFTPGTLFQQSNEQNQNPLSFPLSIDISVSTENVTYAIRKKITVSREMTIAVREGPNSSFVVHQYDPVYVQKKVEAHHVALIISLALAGCVVFIGALAVYFDDKTRKVVLDQHNTVKKFMNYTIGEITGKFAAKPEKREAAEAHGTPSKSPARASTSFSPAPARIEEEEGIEMKQVCVVQVKPEQEQIRRHDMECEEEAPRRHDAEE